MSKKDLFATEIPCSARPITYDEENCLGCDKCTGACQSDVLVPSIELGKPPIVMYPGECIYCGSCVMECPVIGAIKLQHPLLNRSKFVKIKLKEE